MDKCFKRVVLVCVILIGICAVANAQVVDRIVAIVNDDIVTLVELNKQAEPYFRSIMASGYPQDKKKQMIKEVSEKVLDALIDNSLTEQEAKRYQISVSETEVDNAIKNVRESKSLSEAEFLKALEYEGLLLDVYKESIRKQILHARIINVAVKSKVVVTQEDIKAYYDNNPEKYAGNKKYHLKNIVLKDADQANEIREKLKTGASFTDLAQQYSVAPNASDGGELGLYDISSFSENIKNNLSSLGKGQFSEAISTAQGFQIFYVENIVQDGSKTLEQVSQEIQTILYQEQTEKKFNTWLETLKKNAHIKRML